VNCTHMKKRKVLRRLINIQGLSESGDHLARGATVFQAARRPQNWLQDGVRAFWKVDSKLKCDGGRGSPSEYTQGR